MAMEGGIKLRAGAATGATVTEPQSTTSAPARPAQAKSVTEYARVAACASKLHQDGENFVTNVVREAARYNIELKIAKVTASNFEARVLHGNGLAVALIFHETFRRLEVSRAPSCSVTKDVVEQMELLGIEEKLVNVIVVYKSMYELYENVAVGIVNSFHAADDVTFKDMTIADFNASGEIRVSIDFKDAISFAETTTGSPIAHADTAMLVYAKTRKKHGATGYSTDDECKKEPIVAITGFTDLRRVPTDMFNSGYKYNPTFVITGIYSLVRTDEMAMFAISVAADVAIGRGVWRNAFSKFGEGDRNLGNLFIDPNTKKPFVCKNITDMEGVIRNHFTSPVPYLAIDLQEGADQFPGLKDILSNPDRVKRAMKQFTGSESAAQYEIIQGEAKEYDGFVDTQSGKIDTRAVDFLYLVDAKNGPGIAHERAASFLDYPNPDDPRSIEKKVLALEEFYRPEKIELGYTTHRCFLNPDFVAAVAYDMGASINLNVDMYISNQVYDISGMKRFAQPTPFYGSGVSSFGGGYRGFAY